MKLSSPPCAFCYYPNIVKVVRIDVREAWWAGPVFTGTFSLCSECYGKIIDTIPEGALKEGEAVVINHIVPKD